MFRKFASTWHLYMIHSHYVVAWRPVSANFDLFMFPWERIQDGIQLGIVVAESQTISVILLE